MPAPYPRRDPMQGVARAVNRGQAGMAQGRYAGLGRVRRNKVESRETPDPAATTTYYGFLTESNGSFVSETVSAGFNNLIPTGESDFLENGATADYNFTTGVFEVGPAGYWCLQVALTLNNVSDPSDSALLYGITSLAGNVAMPLLYNPATNTLEGALMTAPSWADAGGSFQGRVHYRGGTAQVAACDLSLWPISLA